MNLSNWHALLPDTTPLSRINLPGTHNSPTQFVNLSLFSKCQDKSILQQLEMGVRLFDIRLALNNEAFTAVHGISNCRSAKSKNAALLTFNMIFNDIKTFLEHHPTETVVLSLKMDRGNNTDDFFSKFYTSFIESYSTLWFLENRIPALEECRGKLVLMRRCSLGKSVIIFNDLNSGLDFTKMSNQESTNGPIIPLPSSVKTLDNKSNSFFVVVQDGYMLNPIAKWKKAVEPMLENVNPRKGTIAINFLSTAGFPFLPFINAKYVNTRFQRFHLKPQKFYGWLVPDFLTKKLTSKIIKSNFPEI